MNDFLTGVAYTSECFHCKPGTHSAKAGSAHCTPCPADTYSNKGATVCYQCEKDTYSGMCVLFSRIQGTFHYSYRSFTLTFNSCRVSKITSISYLHVLTHTHTHMQSYMHANNAFIAHVVIECVSSVLSLDLNVTCCVFSFVLAQCFLWLGFCFSRGWFRELPTKICVHKHRLLLHPHSL